MNTYIIDVDETIAGKAPLFKIPQNWRGHPIESDYSQCDPITNMTEKINELYHKGHRIILFTARGMRTFKNNIKLIEEYHKPILTAWLDNHNVLYTELVFGKPWGPNARYVDDRNMSFDQFLME